MVQASFTMSKNKRARIIGMKRLQNRFQKLQSRVDSLQQLVLKSGREFKSDLNVIKSKLEENQSHSRDEASNEDTSSNINSNDNAGLDDKGSNGKLCY